MRKKLLHFFIIILAIAIGFLTQSEAPQQLLLLKQQEKEMMPIFVETLESSEVVAYEKLTEKEQSVYNTLLKGIANQHDKIAVESGVDEAMLDKCIQCIDIDHPELFWMSLGYEWWESRIDGEVSAVSPQYYFTKEEVSVYQPLVIEAAEQMLQGIPDGASDYEKVQYIYETIIKNTVYVDEAEYNQSIYSIFVNGETVCTGYAKALQYLLHEVDIPCAYVYGTADDGKEAGSHAWNIVELDDQYYYVDATWGDSEEPKETAYISYDYLCRDAEYMNQSHVMEIPVSMPECTDDSMNYYQQNGMWHESYDVDVIRSRIKDELNLGEFITFVFENEADYQAMFADLEASRITEWLCEVKGVSSAGIEYWYEEGNTYIDLYWVE